MAQGTFSNNTPSVSRPTEPAIGTATTAADTTNVTVTFTPSTVGGPATSYVISGVPASTAAVTTTLTTTASPATVTGQSAATTYTYTIQPQNFYGLGSRSSSAATSGTIPTVYELTETFNSSGTFTMPTGKTLMSVIVKGGGSSGVSGSDSNDNSANGSGGAGGRGGAGGGTSIVTGYSLAAASTATITVAAAGGISKVTVGATDIATANGASGETPGNGSSNVGGATNITGGTGGAGGTVASYNGNAGSAGVSANASNFNISGFPSSVRGAGGGGGGSAGTPTSYSYALAGKAGGAGGLDGGAAGAQSAGFSGFGGINAQAAGVASAGGGGGGGGGGAVDLPNGSPRPSGGGGSGGAAGRILVYTA